MPIDDARLPRRPGSPPSRSRTRSRSPEARSSHRKWEPSDGRRDRDRRDSRGAGPSRRPERYYAGSEAGEVHEDAPVFEQLDGLARTLAGVIQRHGKVERERAVVGRLEQFQNTRVLNDAQRRLDDADRALADSTADLQHAFTALLHRALARPGVKDGNISTLELDALKHRIARLESHQPAADAKGKRRADAPPTAPPEPTPTPPPPPPEQPAPPPPPQIAPPPPSTEAPPQADAPKDAAKTDDKADAKPDEGKRGRARALLEQVLTRLEEMEKQMEFTTMRCDDFENELNVRDLDWEQRTEEFDKLVARVRRKKEERKAADGEGDDSKGVKESSVQPPPRDATEEGEVKDDKATDQDVGEAPMDIDNTQATRASSPAPAATQAPSTATDDIAMIKQELARVASQLGELQKLTPLESTASVAAQQDGSAAGSETSTLAQEVAQLRAQVQNMVSQVSALEKKATNQDVTHLQQLFERERIAIGATVLQSVKEYLNSQMGAYVDDAIVRALPDMRHKIAEQLIASVRASKQGGGATPMAKTTSGASVQSVQSVHSAPAVGDGSAPGSAQQNTLPLPSVAPRPHTESPVVPTATPPTAQQLLQHAAALKAGQTGASSHNAHQQQAKSPSPEFLGMSPAPQLPQTATAQGSTVLSPRQAHAQVVQALSGPQGQQAIARAHAEAQERAARLRSNHLSPTLASPAPLTSPLPHQPQQQQQQQQQQQWPQGHHQQRPQGQQQAAQLAHTRSPAPQTNNGPVGLLPNNAADLRRMGITPQMLTSPNLSAEVKAHLRAIFDREQQGQFSDSWRPNQ